MMLNIFFHGPSSICHFEKSEEVVKLIILILFPFCQIHYTILFLQKKKQTQNLQIPVWLKPGRKMHCLHQMTHLYFIVLRGFLCKYLIDDVYV